MSVADAPPTRVRRPHVNARLVAVIALAAALVGVGVWGLVDRGTSSAAPGLASPEVARMLDDRLAAFNSGDAEAVAAFYTPDAVLEEHCGCRP